MAKELKTKKTKQSVRAFVASVKDEEKRNDTKRIAAMMEKATGKKPAMWGTSIIGFDSYHYKSQRSAQEGDWPIVGLSPRAANISVYIMPGVKRYASILKKLGKYKMSGGSCLYIKRLSDVNEGALKMLIKISVRDMRKKYKV
jgi:hypothetical protein